MIRGRLSLLMSEKKNTKKILVPHKNVVIPIHTEVTSSFIMRWLNSEIVC